MSLGPDKTICAADLREAMRASLEAKKAGMGANVDLPDVSANFDALGAGLFKLLTADAETASAAAQDPAFWAWVASLRNEVEALRAFAAGVKSAFAGWDPNTPSSGTTLKNNIAALTVPGSTAAAPASLKGRVQ